MVTVGEVGQALVAATGSGNVNVEHSAGSTTVNVGSGDISIGEVTGDVVTKTGSGDVEVGRLAGTLLTKTGSGDLTVRRATTGSVRRNGATWHSDPDLRVFTSGSGEGLYVDRTWREVPVRRASTGSVRANGASGNISIGVEEGTAAWLDVSTLSGRVSQELGETDSPTDGQHRIEITAHTVSGDLRIHRA